MKYKKTRIAQIVGILGCLLVISSCCLFRSPKDPNQIQNPPPPDQNYLACRVNGKPVVFKTPRTWLMSAPSVFKVHEDSLENNLLVELLLQGDYSSKSEDVISLIVDVKIPIKKGLKKSDRIAIRKNSSENTFLIQRSQIIKLEGCMRILELNTTKSKGRVSGVFELKSIFTESTSSNEKFELTDGVFNVVKMKE